MFLSESDLTKFRQPEELCLMVEPGRLGISDEDFFNKSVKLYQKLREAWVLARLGIAISRVISPVHVKVVGEPLVDGVYEFGDGSQWKFEVVTIHKPRRKLGEDYRHGKRPPQALADYSGQPTDPTWPRDDIRKKVEKARKLGMQSHLVAYLDYGLPWGIWLLVVFGDAVSPCGVP